MEIDARNACWASQHDDHAAPEPGKVALHIALLSRSVTAHQTGGMETHGEALRRWLVEAGHRVTTITTTLPQGPATIKDAWGTTLYLAGGQPGAYSHAWGAEMVENLLALHERDPFNVVASQSAAAYPYLALRRRHPPQQRIPTVLMNHGTVLATLPIHLREVWRRPAHVLLKRLPEDARNFWNDRRRYPLAEHITVLSDADKAAICRWLSIASERVTIIPNGVDTAAFSPSDTARVQTRTQLGIAADEIAIGILARLEPRKGQHVILQALGHPLLRDTPRPIHLVLIGDGPSRDLLRSQAERLGLSRRVTFLGAVAHEETPALLNAMDIVALPSLYEGMPLSLLEAMACGRAVIASRVGAVESMITHAVTGLIIPAGDAVALARAVDSLVRNPDYMATIGARAREDVVARRAASLTLQTYERVLSDAATRGIACRANR
jgi:glycosyltransferase involved in cell wall biosynthesis